MNFLKEKWEYLMARLKTPEGRFDILIGAFIAGFIIVNYTRLVFSSLQTFFSFLKFSWLITYMSYLVYGLLWVPLGYGISWINTQAFKYLKKLKKQMIGGR